MILLSSCKHILVFHDNCAWIVLYKFLVFSCVMLSSTNFVETILPQNRTVEYGDFLMFSIAVEIEVVLFSDMVNYPFIRWFAYLAK